MSTLDPSDVPCLPCQQGYYAKAHVCDIPDYCPCDQQDKHSARRGEPMSTHKPGRLYMIDIHGVTRAVHYCADGFFRCGEDFSAMATSDLNARLAIVLDSEEVTKQISNAGSELAENRLLADMVRTGLQKGFTSA